MGPQNGLIGNDYTTEIPQTQVSDDGFKELVKAAKFSKTREYQELKKHLESRITFYQSYLPDGRNILTVDDNLGEMWKVANAIVGELKAIMDVYEQAAEMVKNESRRPTN